MYNKKKLNKKENVPPTVVGKHCYCVRIKMLRRSLDKIFSGDFIRIDFANRRIFT